MTNYARGTALERRAQAALTEDGYYVLRSAGSHGLIDLVALKQGEILAVQVKADGYMLPADWDALYRLALEVGAVPLLASREGRRLVFWRLTGLKTRRNPPRELWTADRVAA